MIGLRSGPSRGSLPMFSIISQSLKERIYKLDKFSKITMSIKHSNVLQLEVLDDTISL